MQSNAVPAALPIPEDLRACAISLHHLGVREVALIRQNAVDIISALQGSKWAILGGDVLVERDGAFRHSGDSWHTDRMADDSCPEFIDRSHRESRSYIERFPEKPDSA